MMIVATRPITPRSVIEIRRNALKVLSFVRTYPEIEYHHQTMPRWYSVSEADAALLRTEHVRMVHTSPPFLEKDRQWNGSRTCMQVNW